MTLPNRNYYTGVKLTLALKSAPATTKTVWFTNRHSLHNTAADTVYWPILQDLSDLGVEADLYMPKQTTGFFTIDNSPGSFGFRRKFSDVLERYTPTAVTVYIDGTSHSTTDVSFDPPDKIWEGTIESIDNDFMDGAQSLRFNVILDIIPDRTISMQIDSAYTDYADAPNESLGKHLPLVVGGPPVFVPGYRISALGSATSATYALATDLDEFLHEAWPTGYYAQGYDGDWVEITGNDAQSAPTGASKADYAFDSTNERIFELADLSGSQIIAGWQITVTDQGPVAGGTTAALHVKLYEFDPTSYVIGRVVAQGGVDLTTWTDASSNTYDDLNDDSSGTFDIYGPFNTPAVMDTSRFGYALGVEMTNWQANDASWDSVEGNANMWLRGAGDTEPVDYGSQDSGNLLVDLVYASTVSATLGDDGFRGSQITFSTSGASTAPSIAFDSLNIIFKLGGIEDDGSGSVSGGANTRLVRPDHIIDLIEREWDGADFSSTGNWDLTTLSDEYDAAYAASGNKTRQLEGFMEGQLKLWDVIESICQDSASRVGVDNAGKLFLWPWGVEYDVQATIPPRDIIPLSWEIGDKTSVINRVTFAYGKTSVNINLQRNLMSGQRVNYGSNIDWHSTTNALTSELSADSVTLYGTRALEAFTTNWIASDTAAETLAESYLARFPYAEQRCTFLVPMEGFVAGYNGLKMFDVIKFYHPDFPAFYGTDPDSSEGVESGLGAGDANAQEGHYSYRAKTYRGLIEGRYIVQGATNAPLIKLVVRILENYPGDPT